MLSARLALPLAAVLALPPAFAACSFLVEDSIEQCQTDGQCNRLRTGFVCDTSEGVCVRSDDLGLCARADKPSEELPAEITRSTTLYCSKNYQLNGYVRVLPGAKIVADGKPDAPIVFTSASDRPTRGEWGGVAILGNAPINLRDALGNPILGELDGVTEPINYGGGDRDDDSGIFRFVRIEYSGFRLAAGLEVNGLTLAGVGQRTVVDSVQVRETLDDCFAFSGGTVNAKHLICQHGGDDGFDLEQGYQGKLQFLVFQQDPVEPGEFLPNGLEAENADDEALFEPITSPTVYNATLCGRGPASSIDLEHYGVLLRDATRGRFANLIVSGFDAGFGLGGAVSANNTGDGLLDVSAALFFDNITSQLANNEVAGGEGKVRDDDGGFDESAWITGRPGTGTQKPAAFGDCFDATALRLRPSAALADGAATPPSDGFFDASATYYGAFRDENDDWASGPWVVWTGE
jgi:hypothetical protein